MPLECPGKSAPQTDHRSNPLGCVRGDAGREFSHIHVEFPGFGFGEHAGTHRGFVAPLFFFPSDGAFEERHIVGISGHRQTICRKKNRIRPCLFW